MGKILTKHKSRILLRIVSFFANCQFQLRRTYCDTLLLPLLMLLLPTLLLNLNPTPHRNRG